MDLENTGTQQKNQAINGLSRDKEKDSIFKSSNFSQPGSQLKNEHKKDEKENSSSGTGVPILDEALESVKTYANSATHFVKANPVAILLGACAVGATFAWIVSRKKPMES